MKRGYFGIGVENIKTKINIGTLFRSAMNFEADFIFTIHKRYEKQSSNTVKAESHIPLWDFENIKDFEKHIPFNCIPIGIEITKEAKNIINFVHPERAIYILGAEDAGITSEIQSFCKEIIYIPSNFCLNVSVAGAIVMYDRFFKSMR